MRNTSIIPQNIFIYGYSHGGGSSFEQLMCLDTTIVSFFFQKKKKREKEKERGDIHNQSINYWCLTHLSCISEALYG